MKKFIIENADQLIPGDYIIRSFYGERIDGRIRPLRHKDCKVKIFWDDHAGKQSIQFNHGQEDAIAMHYSVDQLNDRMHWRPFKMNGKSFFVKDQYLQIK